MDGFLVDPALVTSWLLVLARVSAWAMAAPALAGRALPPVARIALSVPLAVALQPLAGEAEVPEGVVALGTAVVVQVGVGIAFGWLVNLMITALEMAGALVDAVGGLSVGQIFDPVTGANGAAFSRVISMTALGLLVATPAFSTVLMGFALSFRAVPLDVVPSLSADAPAVVAAAADDALLAAVVVAAPVLGVLVLTDVALALGARFVPQAGVFVLGLPVKVLVALAVGGGLLVGLPGTVVRLAEVGVEVPGEVFVVDADDEAAADGTTDDRATADGTAP